MLRILADFSTNRQVANNLGIPYPKQDSAQVGAPSHSAAENTPYQHIPEQRQEVQNLVGDFQCPLEVLEEPRASNNPAPTMENRNVDPILNQQWDEPLHLQPPIRPTSVPGSQTTSNVVNTTSPNTATGENLATPTTRRQIENLMEEGQGKQSNDMRPTGPNIQMKATVSVTNRCVDQNSCTHCSCHSQPLGGNISKGDQPTGQQRLNLHGEYDDRNDGISNFFRGTRYVEESGSRECQIIRILPDESNDYMDIVRDSVSAQTHTGQKPMFVNNYFVGENNWRKISQTRYDTPTNREVAHPQQYKQLFPFWEKKINHITFYKQVSRE